MSVIFITRLRRAVPKYHSGEALGFEYKVRPVGFWRPWTPVRFAPYFNGDTIQVHISLKAKVVNQAWQTGIIQISPDVVVAGISDPLERAIRSSDTVFPFVPSYEWPRGSNTAPKYKFFIGKWWSRTITLKGGGRFVQESTFECKLILQNIIDEGNVHVQQADSFLIADIEVAARGPFMATVWMWIIGLGLPFIGVIGGLIGWLLRGIL
jgi:hypothetical protein